MAVVALPDTLVEVDGEVFVISVLGFASVGAFWAFDGDLAGCSALRDGDTKVRVG